VISAQERAVITKLEDVGRRVHRGQNTLARVGGQSANAQSVYSLYSLGRAVEMIRPRKYRAFRVVVVEPKCHRRSSSAFTRPSAAAARRRTQNGRRVSRPCARR